MDILLNPKEDEDLNFRLIRETIDTLEVILTKNEIYNKIEFKEWQNVFDKIYGKKHTNLQLYIAYTLIYSISYFFISKYILKNNDINKENNINFKKIKVIEEKIKFNNQKLDIFGLKYFNPFFTISEKEDLSFFFEVVFNVSNYLFNLSLKPEYFFDYLIQNIISPLIRHKSGEYYTPPFLAKQMVDEAYSFGETVLDPCCGSGNFIVEVIKKILAQHEPKEKKIKALNVVFGYDINPISIYLSKINLLYLLNDLISDIKLNLYVFDFLFQNSDIFEEYFDLVIGNPPWYTYRDIESIDYQERVKKLAENLEIKPLPKNLLNIEVSTLFFMKANKFFMKEHAKIFFVITKGVITGSHASRFRNFKGFSSIKIWTFEKKIENLFNIDFICLFGQKASKNLKNSLKEIKSYHFILSNESEVVDYFKPIKLKLDKIIPMIPYYIEKRGENLYPGKLVSKDKAKKLLPIKKSYYKPFFHKGADLNPRNLIFIKFKRLNDGLIIINPDIRIFKRAKAPWNKSEFNNITIERDYLFKVIKSTELVKFHVYNHYDVFLPLKKSDLSFVYDSLEPYAKLFYDKINDIYKKYKKATTKHETLMDNINRWSKLINIRQTSKIKIVYNNSGSMLNAAVVQGDYLVTGDLCFYDTNNLEEAHYLAAILNSNLMTQQIKILKSSRHIFKLPFDFPIKKFDSENPYHLKLANLGKQARLMAKKVISDISTKNKINYTKFKIQSSLSQLLKPYIIEIDEILTKELKSS